MATFAHLSVEALPRVKHFRGGVLVYSLNLVRFFCAHQAPLSMGFLRQEYWSGLLLPSPEDLANPGIKPASSALEADSLPLRHQRKPLEAESSSFFMDLLTAYSVV